MKRTFGRFSPTTGLSIAGLTMLSDITPRFIRRFITWRLSHTIKVRKDKAPGSLGITEGYAQYIPDGGSTVIKGLNAYFSELEEKVTFNLHPSCTQVPKSDPEDAQEKDR